MPFLPYVLGMADPFSWTAFFIALGASAAATGAQMLLSRVFAPKRAPVVRGKLSGDLYVQNGEPGAVIKKIHGGDTGDGRGHGILTAGEVLWMSRIRKVVTTSQQSSGGKGFGGGGTQEVQDVNYYVDIAVMYGFGPLDFHEVRANGEVIYLNDQVHTGDIYEAEDGQLVDAAAVVTSPGASNAKAVHFGGVGSGVNFFVPRIAAAAGEQTLHFYYSAAADATAGIYLAGGLHTTIPLEFTGNLDAYSVASVTVPLDVGLNTVGIAHHGGGAFRVDYLRNEPVNDVRTGMLVPDRVPRDPDYTQGGWPALVAYRQNVDRWNELPPPDEFGVRSGVVHAGGYAGLRFYEGNATQLPDPTIEAEVDGRLGEGSTPAYRHRGYMVAENFSITKFGGTVPIFMARCASKDKKTMRAVMESEAVASGVSLADVDFAAFAGHKIRGHFVASLQSARQTHDSLARAFNTKLTEHDGKIVGVTLGLAAAVAVDEADLGIIDEGRPPGEDNTPLRRVDVTHGAEIAAAKTTNLLYFSPTKKYERGDVSYDLIDIASQRVEHVELPMTLTDDEAQAVAVREAHKQLVETTEGYNLNLPYKYRKLYPTRTLTVTDEGVTYFMRVSSINGAPGRPLEIIGVPEDTASYATTIPGSDIVGDVPLVPIPAMTVGALIDSVLLRDGDETNNNGVGFYAAARKRTGQGNWDGWALAFWRDEWMSVAQSNIPATMGIAANILLAGQTAVFDDHPSANEHLYLDVDLYDGATLESATEAECFNGKNVAIYDEGDRLEIIQFKTAVKLDGFTNRWRLSGLRRGLRGTEHAVDDHVAGARFILLNDAVVFVPMSVNELRVERDWKFVTLVKNGGQSLTDAATIKWAFLGGTKRPLAPWHFEREDDAAGNILISFTARTRVMGGARAFYASLRGEELERFYIRFPGATPPRTASAGPRRQRLLLRDTPDSTPIVPRQESVQLLDSRDSQVDLLMSVDFDGATCEAILYDAAAGSPGVSGRAYRLVYNGSLLTVAHYDGSLVVTKSFPPGTLVIRAAIEIVGGEVYYYGDIPGDSTPAFCHDTLPTEAGTQLRLRVFGVFGTWADAHVVDGRDGRLSYVYRIEDQTRDFGGHVARGALAVEAWQDSQAVGQGFIAEVTL